MTNILVTENNGMLKTNSINVAQVFNKEHRNIKRDILNLDCSEEFRALNYEQSSFTTKQKKVLPCVNMTKDGFMFLCMGFRGKKAAKYKEAYIQEFNRMADTLNSLSNRINSASIKGMELSKLGSEWAKVGHMVKREKKAHKDIVESLMNEVQLKLEV